jgi:prevent-host-death family protein
MMSMETIPISKFKATCLAILERVRRTGEPIIVTKRGVPIAKVIPAPSDDEPKIGFGAMKGTFEILGDIVGPSSSIDEWSGDERNIAT